MTERHEKIDDLLINLRKVMRAIDLHSKHLVQKFGLTGPQLMIIKAISENQTVDFSGSQLASVISLSQATVTSILDRLVEKGFVNRKKSQSDKRKTYLTTTAKAEKILLQKPELLQESFIEQFLKLEEWEQALITSSIQRIATMMGAKQLGAAPFLASAELK